jgi:hypothetical protein
MFGQIKMEIPWYMLYSHPCENKKATGRLAMKVGGFSGVAGGN